MNYDKFLEAVARRAGTSTAQSATLTQATLRTLAERISGGQARDLALQLPQELQECLRKPGEFAEPFGLTEFTRRVSSRAGVDLTQARDGVQAVLVTLRDAVRIGEYEDAVAQLSKDFRQILEPIEVPAATQPGGHG